MVLPLAQPRFGGPPPAKERHSGFWRDSHPELKNPILLSGIHGVDRHHMTGPTQLLNSTRHPVCQTSSPSPPATSWLLGWALSRRRAIRDRAQLRWAVSNLD